MEEIVEAYRDVPYFNNKSRGRRAGLAVEIGKGSPRQIQEEIEALAKKEKVDLQTVNLKKFIVDHDIGIECSGFAYHVLSAFGKGELKEKLKFPYIKGILGTLRIKFRPVENTDVKTFAHDLNSKKIEIKDVKIGDIITMTKGTERDHILVITKVEYPIIHYVHAIAWPSDGEYGHGIHEGTIKIVDLEKDIVDQKWVENGKEGEENYTHALSLIHI
jgi:hypothetical protein